MDKIPTIPSYRNYERKNDTIINKSNTKLNTIHIGSTLSNEIIKDLIYLIIIIINLIILMKKDHLVKKKI